MKLDPSELYLFTFQDAEGKDVIGGYEQPRAALTYAKTRHLKPFVISGGRVIPVGDHSVI